MTNEQLQMIGISETAFSEATEADRVEWGKKNWTAWGGLCAAAKSWILKMNSVVIGTFKTDGITSGMDRRSVPVIRTDYQPPVERWWFNPDTKQIAVYPQRPWTVAIEVTADYAAYLSAKPEGEWELRKPEIGDVFIGYSGIKEHHELIWDAVNERGSSDKDCYRWCKPKAVDGWVKYPVVVRGGFYMVSGYNGSDMRLDKAANRVGFGGVQFEGDHGWFINPQAFVTPSKAIEVICDMGCYSPAIPVLCRFWEVPK